jgi:membrane protease YdiL (CAAX protease family)
MQVRPQVEVARQPHPEHVPYWKFVLSQWYRAFFQPKIRLDVRFPWGLKEFSKYYVIAAVYYVIGSIIPIVLIFGGVIAALHFAPEKMVNVVATKDGHPNMYVVLAATLTSFLCGFGAELYYINKQLRKTGMSISKVIGLNLDSLNGSWPEAIKRSIVALGVALMVQNALDLMPMPKPQQAAADMASNLDAGGMVGFIVLAAILAPFFEEVIFRGFVFNAFRNILSEGRIFKFLGNSKRLADYGAIGISSLLFAAAHMDASAFLHLFAIGVVLAELYRRSGTLWCPMLLHAMNNLIATMLIISGKA